MHGSPGVVPVLPAGLDIYDFLNNDRRMVIFCKA